MSPGPSEIDGRKFAEIRRRTIRPLPGLISSMGLTSMQRWRVPIFPFDKAIAKVIAHRSTPTIQRTFRWTTLLADEKILSGLAIGAWLLARGGTRQQQAETGHIARVVLVTSAVPHMLKHFLAQERPDRLETGRKRHGIKESGKAFDAFPSGHAVHMGALAAAIARTRPRYAAFAWSGGALIALTRIALLAHWTSDVLAGGAVGLAIESMLHSLSRDEG